MASMENAVILMLKNLANQCMENAREQREENAQFSYGYFKWAEELRKAAEVMERQIPQEIEMEGGGSTWWHVCPECHGAIDCKDHFCRHCGQAVKNQVIRDIEKKLKLEEEWVESEFGIYREN